jgi:spore germination protein KA
MFFVGIIIKHFGKATLCNIFWFVREGIRMNINKTLKNIFLFNEPKKVEHFILKENENDQIHKSKRALQSNIPPNNSKEVMLYKRTPDSKRRRLTCELSTNNQQFSVSASLADNLQIMKKTYYIPKNGDIILREFDVTIKNETRSAFILFFDGLTDTNIINAFIMQPLMLLSNMHIKSKEADLSKYIKNSLLPQNQLKEATSFEDIVEGVNFGGCALFVDGMDLAFVADVKGWEHRGVERPQTELVIRGPQEGFTEGLRINTALIRKILKDENLIAENISIGTKSKTPCSLMYLQDLANESLVKEVRRRLESIKIEYLTDSGELEQFLEDSTFMTAPQIIATERPDRVASMLAEGKVAVVVDGSPFVLVMPASLVALLHTAEDSYLRFPYGNFLRLVRTVGLLFALLLPGMYVAITNYHHEMIPTDLLFSIVASREKVPFPSVVEILIMELAFELIREAGIRIPGPIGPTLGIIGALILGQAAVAASIVSPILIIVVAVTGIGSFSIPNFSLALGFRILRFSYILLGALAGFLGISFGLFVHGLMLVNAKSFGVPYLVPFAPKTLGGLADTITRTPVWQQEKRPDFLNTKDDRRQAQISREWVADDEKNDNQ